MIVEFIGSSGAGKTTLISEVRRRMANIIDMATPFDLVASRFGLRDVIQPTARNVIQELIGFPFFVGSLRKHKAYVAFMLRMLSRQAKFSVFTLNNLRSLERKIGVYEIIKRNPKNQIVLVDEGTVLSAHNVFVYSNAVYTHEEIATFASLVPLPDVIVYIKAPVDILVQRTLERVDPPREMKRKSPQVVRTYVHRAVEMFDQLVEVEALRHRLLIVENSDSYEYEYETAVNNIIEFILNYQLSQRSSNAWIRSNLVNQTHG